MVNKRITELPSAAVLTGDELVPVVQNGITKQAQISAMLNNDGILTSTLTNKIGTAHGQMVLVSGRDALFDGGEGIVIWDANDNTTTPNNGTVWHAGTTGRWKRVEAEGGQYNIKWFGAVGDNTANDYTAIQSALDAAGAAGGGRVYIPEGTFRVASQLTINYNNIEIYGVGNNSIISVDHSGYGLLINTKYYCRIYRTKWTTPLTSNIGLAENAINLYIGHHSAIQECTFENFNKNGGSPIRMARTYYNEISHNTMTVHESGTVDNYTGSIGLFLSGEANGNHILSNQFSGFDKGICLTNIEGEVGVPPAPGDACNGTTISGNNIESGANSAPSAGISMEGTWRCMINANRIEYTAGAHIQMIAGVGIATDLNAANRFNQIVGNVCFGPAAGLILGEASAYTVADSNNVIGGSYGAVTLNTDADKNSIVGGVDTISGTLTDNGTGSIIKTNAAGGKWYTKNGANIDDKLTVGGSGTIQDTGTNYLEIQQIINSVPNTLHTKYISQGTVPIIQTSNVAMVDTSDGGGTSGYITLTGAKDIAARSTGVGTIKFNDATSRDSSGFLKIYIGTTAYYIPIFSAI